MTEPIPTGAITDDRRPGWGIQRWWDRLGPIRLLVGTTVQLGPWEPALYLLWGRDVGGGWPVLPGVLWQGWRGGNVIEFGVNLPAEDSPLVQRTLTITRNPVFPDFAYSYSSGGPAWPTTFRVMNPANLATPGNAVFLRIPEWMDVGVVWPTAVILDKFV